jgi:hypothetical protein
MSPVQLAHLTDEELVRHAYIENESPMVLELASRMARLLDENAELNQTITDLSEHIPH